MRNANFLSVFGAGQAAASEEPQTTNRPTPIVVLVKILHLLAAIPMNVFRVSTVAKWLSISEDAVTSELNRSETCNLDDVMKDLPHIIRPVRGECGNPDCTCGNQGVWVSIGVVKAYSLDGVKDAEVYIFKCHACGSETGTTTVTLHTGVQVIYFA